MKGEILDQEKEMFKEREAKARVEAEIEKDTGSLHHPQNEDTAERQSRTDIGVIGTEVSQRVGPSHSKR